MAVAQQAFESVRFRWLTGIGLLLGGFVATYFLFRWRWRSEVSVIVLGDDAHLSKQTALAQVLCNGAPVNQDTLSNIGVVVHTSQRFPRWTLKIFDIFVPVTGWARIIDGADVLVLPVDPFTVRAEQLADVENCLVQDSIVSTPLFIAVLVDNESDWPSSVALLRERAPRLLSRTRLVIHPWSSRTALGLDALELFIEASLVQLAS